MNQAARIARQYLAQQLKTARAHPDVDNLFKGFFTRGPGVEGAVAQAIKDLRKAVDVVSKALEKEVETAQSGDFGFAPPRYPADMKQMQALIKAYLIRNYSLDAKFADGFASQVVWGENY